MKKKFFSLVSLSSLLLGLGMVPVTSHAENKSTTKTTSTESIVGNEPEELSTVNSSSSFSTEEVKINESSDEKKLKSVKETINSTESELNTEKAKNEPENEKKAEISYLAHVQEIGWQNPVKNGEIAGTTGKNLSVEGIKINLEASGLTGGIQYKAHVRNIGWQDWVNQGALSGTVGKALPTEAYQIKLTGEIYEKYDVYYRVHSTNLGWLDWAKNGEMAGSEGFAYSIQAVQIQLVEKGEKSPGSMARPYVKRSDVDYQAYVNGKGWQSAVTNGKTAGTTGEDRGVEGLKAIVNDSTTTGSIQYKAHVKNVGWQDWSADNNITGIVGKNQPIEAIQAKLTGQLAETYDIYYRVHSSNLGWLDWAKNSESSGSEGFAYKVEAVQMKLVPKYNKAPGKTNRPFVKREKLVYETHVQEIGWQSQVVDGQIAGTTGKNLAVEGLRLKVEDQLTSGTIQYKAHVRNIGWQNWVNNYQLSGTVGKALPTEAYQIDLTGELSENYDVYYRVHSQNFGWLGWAKNGQSAGTAGYAYNVEAMQMKLVPKGWDAPGKVGGAFKEKPKSNVLTNVPYVSQYRPIMAPWGCAAASMTMPLRAKGVNVDLKYAFDNLPMYPQYPGGQKGNVYTGIGFGWVITPQTLTEYMKKWYPNVYNISGSSTNKLIDEVLEGNPVMYYGYSSYQKDDVRNHVKVITGYKDNKFLVYDPLYYTEDAKAGSNGPNKKYDRGAKHWVSVSEFNKEYNKQAIVVR